MTTFHLPTWHRRLARSQSWEISLTLADLQQGSSIHDDEISMSKLYDDLLRVRARLLPHLLPDKHHRARF